MKDLLITKNGVPAFAFNQTVSCSDAQYILQMLYCSYMRIAHSDITGYQTVSRSSIESWLGDYLRQDLRGNPSIDPARISVKLEGDSSEMRSRITYTMDTGEVLDTSAMPFPFSVDSGRMTSLDDPSEWLSVFTNSEEFDERVFVTLQKATTRIEVASLPIVSEDSPGYLFVEGVSETFTTTEFSIDIIPGKNIYLIAGSIAETGKTIISASLGSDAWPVEVVSLSGEPCIRTTAEITETFTVSGTCVLGQVAGISTEVEITDRIDMDPVYQLRPHRGRYVLVFRSLVREGNYWLAYPARRQVR